MSQKAQSPTRCEISWRSSKDVPKAWQLSTINVQPWFCTMSLIPSISVTCPARFTTITALMRRNSSADSRSQISRICCRPVRPVVSSTSAKMTSPPTYNTALAVAAKLMADTMTESPGPMPIAIKARCRAAVPLEQETAYCAPVTAASFFSKFSTAGPVVSQSLFKTPVTASISSWSIYCLP